VEEEGFGAVLVIAKHGPYSASATVESAAVRVYYSTASGSSTPDAALYASRKTDVTWQGAYREDPSDGAYARVSQELGELPRLPPSGLEKREVQLFVKNSRGLLPAPTPPSQESDPGIDAIEAVVSYRPCWIGRI
jgi:hypothetical protein